jgi:(2Fe-2S) ferredoxin
MSQHQHQQKRIRPLRGHFLGWEDDCTPHRYMKLATSNGEQRIKIAKSLRPHIQDWQRGVYLTLLAQETINRDTGEQKIKVKQLLNLPSINLLELNLVKDISPQLIDDRSVITPIVSTKIQVCHGSSCRRRGSDKICQAMQSHLDQHNLTAQVKIEPVKCLHQCKAAPHAIIASPASAMVPGKTHYRQVQSSQVLAILAKHLPIVLPSEPTTANLIEKIAAYLQQHQISTTTTL